MYYKLSWRSMRKYLTDYFIYAVTLISLIIVMYISIVFTTIGELESNLQSNSLPIFIACVMICLLNYVTNYILSTRSKELALYMYMGMDKNLISNLFFTELLIVSFLCFVFGITLAAALAKFTILLSINVNLSIAILLSTIIKTLLYFMFIQLVIFMWEKRKIRNLQIKDMLMKRQIRNKKKFCQGKLFMWLNLFVICSFLFILLFALIVINFNEIITSISISFISLPFILLIIFFYRLVLEFINKLRSQHSFMLYKNDRLFIVAQLLKKLAANSLLFSLTSLCLIISIFANITSIVFVKANIPFGDEDKFWMTSSQELISVVFLVIFFSVLSIRQVSDLRECIKSINILESMGKTKKNIRLLLLKQIIFNFSMPMIMPIGIIISIMYPLERFVFQIINLDNLIFNGLINCILLILPMFLIYLLSAYITSIKMWEKSKLKIYNL